MLAISSVYFLYVFAFTFVVIIESCINVSIIYVLPTIKQWRSLLQTQLYANLIAFSYSTLHILTARLYITRNVLYRKHANCMRQIKNIFNSTVYIRVRVAVLIICRIQ